MMGIMRYMLSMTAGHTDYIFKEVEINRRRFAVHAVSQQYTTIYVENIYTSCSGSLPLHPNYIQKRILNTRQK